MQGLFLTIGKSCYSAVAGGQRALSRLAAAAVWSVLVLFLSAGLAPLRAQSLEPVDVDVSQKDGYGRIVLTFKDRTLLPIYDALITGGVLRISFEEPIDINVDDVPLDLKDYVAIARRDPDGSAIRFALKNQFKINTLEAGEKLFVDILPLNWQGLPPGLPDDVVRELAKRAEAAMRKVRALEQARLKVQEGPEVALYVGEHPTFTRLVFDWSIKFDTAFVRENDIIKLTFNHPAQLDISHLRAHLPQGVIDATSFLDQGKLKFLMRIEPSVDIRAFREEQTYVIDVTPENMTANDPANALINKELSVEDNENRQSMITAPGLRDTREVKEPRGLPSSGPTVSTGGNIMKESEADDSPAYTVVPLAPAKAGEGTGLLDTGQPPTENPDLSNSAPPEGPRLAMVPRSKPVRSAQTETTTTATAVEALPAPDLVASVLSPADADDVHRSDGLITSAIPDPAAGKREEDQAAAAPVVTAQAAPGALPLSGSAPVEVQEEEFVRQAPMLDLSTQQIEPPQDPDQNQDQDGAQGDAGDIQTLPQGDIADGSAEGAMPSPQDPSEMQQPLSLGGSDVPAGIQLPRRSQSAVPDVWRATGGQDLTQMPDSPETPPAEFAEEVRNFVSAEARRIGNTVRVVFPFSEPVSSAVFRRNDSIWLVFDTDATIDTRGMVSALAETAEAIDVHQFEDYQILRMDMNDPVLATVGVDGNAWSLVIGDMILEPSIPLKLERNIRGDGGSALRVLYQEPQNIRQVEDPFVGDTISLVTGFGPPRGLLKPQNFVDLSALSSAQGIAIASKSDGVKMKILGDDVIIEKDGGLSLSSEHLRGGTGAFNRIIDPAESNYIEFVSLSTEGPGAYRSRLQELQDRLAQSPEGKRRQPLMALARFYLAHQFAQEAQGLMKLALEEEPAMAEDSSFNLMMGAAQTMANRPEEAYHHLNRPELKNSPDAAIWQTIVDVKLGHWTPARIAMPRGRAVVGNYPSAIQTEFKLAAAQASVEVNDFGVANGILAEIEPSEVTRAQAARYDILRGRVADASGRSQEALTVFDLVTRSDDRPRAAEAEYRALRIRYRDGELGIDEAIDRLAGLATSWRGDEIELKTLRFLAQLYAERGQYREAFEAMRSAVQAEPDADTTRLLQEEMNGLFNSLFLDGKVDEMPTIKALALYYDFRELTPIGRRGDEMVRLLAEKLVEVDLLGQATDLLRHQVDNRLKGAARAQIAADLAAIYLMDRKADEALRVLNRTRQASLPSTLERQRNIVEARALTESGRPDLALELVRNMRGSDVDRLRGDTFWAAESWREAGEQFEAMHGSRWSDNIPLDDLERRDILRAGIAFSLAGDRLSLERLQTKYMTKMSNSPEALAFEIVTRPFETQGVEFLEIANQLADVDSLETFLKEYRRQYMSPDRSPDQSTAVSQAGDAAG
ncbi:tetratricopeptide repeat protein [uncultured Roseibium sp.]|uniref:tetratricopeptide repeat protein n=1 Tax=uncultured Roseibium sp. TaxID=1936171 RepID=UPI0026067AE2|nr:tetratricopeptide repeat protein [uncultured Roseibium sp.]